MPSAMALLSDNFAAFTSKPASIRRDNNMLFRCTLTNCCQMQRSWTIVQGRVLVSTRIYQKLCNFPQNLRSRPNAKDQIHLLQVCWDQRQLPATSWHMANLLLSLHTPRQTCHLYRKHSGPVADAKKASTASTACRLQASRSFIASTSSASKRGRTTSCHTPGFKGSSSKHSLWSWRKHLCRNRLHPVFFTKDFFRSLTEVPS